MKPLTNIFFFGCFLICSSCISYTKALTKTNEMDAEFLAEKLKPGKTYKVKLKSEREFLVKVLSINTDSLYGWLYFKQGSHYRRFKTSVSLQDIVDVKEGRTDVVPTAILIAVPVALYIIAIDNISLF